MRNLETIISDMRSTRDVSRENANVATHPTIREIASLYADLLTGYIIRLEEANHLINLQTQGWAANLNSCNIMEDLSDRSSGY